MMDITNSEKQLNQVDRFLTTLTKVLKKHWIVLILIALGALGYWLVNLPDPAAGEVHYMEYYDESADDEYVQSEDTVAYEDVITEDYIEETE